LVLLQPTHHDPFPPLTPSTSGNHCSRKPSTDFCNKISAKRTHDLPRDAMFWNERARIVALAALHRKAPSKKAPYESRFR
jgi:hypothetical protein